MAASAQRGPTRADPVSHVPVLQESAGGHPLPPPVAGGGRGIWWERSFIGNKDQLTLLRAVLGSLLAGCPMADDVILLMSELGANAVRHSGSGRGGGIFTARLLDFPGEYVLGVIEDGGSEWDGDLQGSAREASGLFLVLAMSADCGVYGGRRKRAVWFRMPYPPDGRTPHARAVAPDALTARIPGKQVPPFLVPRWSPSVPGWASVDPKVMERVRVALIRL
jgi:hypothetical protein